EHGNEGDDLQPVYAAVPVGAEVGDGEQGGPVEDDLGTRRPGGDLRTALAPHEEDEERDREQERDAGEDQQRAQGGLELEDDERADDGQDDQEPAQRRVHPREERPHVPVMYARTPSAPATRVAPANQPSRARRSAGAYSHGASTARS